MMTLHGKRALESVAKLEFVYYPAVQLLKPTEQKNGLLNMPAEYYAHALWHVKEGRTEEFIVLELSYHV